MKQQFFYFLRMDGAKVARYNTLQVAINHGVDLQETAKELGESPVITINGKPLQRYI